METMNLKAENRLHFGVPIFESHIPELEIRRESIKQSLLKLRSNEKVGMNRSNQRGWHSSDNLHQSTDPVLQWLTEQIFQLGSQLIRHADRTIKDKPIFLSSLWSNINESGAWNMPHAHMPCEWSGCAYVDIPEPEEADNGIVPGDIIFFDPMLLGGQYRRPPTVNYTPSNGKVFLFPGYLLHMVAPHYCDLPRISVAFNFRLSESLDRVGL